MLDLLNSSKEQKFVFPTTYYLYQSLLNNSIDQKKSKLAAETDEFSQVIGDEELWSSREHDHLGREGTLSFIRAATAK
jgi:hypothetical protein